MNDHTGTSYRARPGVWVAWHVSHVCARTPQPGPAPDSMAVPAAAGWGHRTAHSTLEGPRSASDSPEQQEPTDRQGKQQHLRIGRAKDMPHLVRRGGRPSEAPHPDIQTLVKAKAKAGAVGLADARKPLARPLHARRLSFLSVQSRATASLTLSKSVPGISEPGPAGPGTYAAPQERPKSCSHSPSLACCSIGARREGPPGPSTNALEGMLALWVHLQLEPDNFGPDWNS